MRDLSETTLAWILSDSTISECTCSSENCPGNLSFSITAMCLLPSQKPLKISRYETTNGRDPDRTLISFFPFPFPVCIRIIKMSKIWHDSSSIRNSSITSTFWYQGRNLLLFFSYKKLITSDSVYFPIRMHFRESP